VRSYVRGGDERCQVRFLVGKLADVETLVTANGEAVTHRIPTPPYADGTDVCVFELVNPGYAGSTAIFFTPRP
jgi:hypothetical protein